jgi:hypothetical protein
MATSGGQPSGGQRITLIVASGGKTDVKQSSKVPLVTGVYTPGESQRSDVQFQDVGLKIEATVDGYADGVRLRTRIAQSSVADEKSGVGSQGPRLPPDHPRTATLVPGKPLILGSLDIPGTNPPPASRSHLRSHSLNTVHPTNPTRDQRREALISMEGITTFNGLQQFFRVSTRAAASAACCAISTPPKNRNS